MLQQFEFETGLSTIEILASMDHTDLTEVLIDLVLKLQMLRPPAQPFYTEDDVWRAAKDEAVDDLRELVAEIIDNAESDEVEDVLDIVFDKHLEIISFAPRKPH